MKTKQILRVLLIVGFIGISTYAMASTYVFRAPAHGVKASAGVGGGEIPIEVPADPVEEETDQACYTATAGTVGTMPGCEGMLIMNDYLMWAASQNGFKINHSDGVTYTFGNSEHNIFTGQIKEMQTLFADTTFNEDIGYWDTTNVENMEFMFAENAYFNQDISGWNTSKVQSMDFMFGVATSFNQDLSFWDVEHITSPPTFFADDTPAWSLPKPCWGEVPGSC